MDLLNDYLGRKEGEHIWETNARLLPFKALYDTKLYSDWELEMFEELLILVLVLCEKDGSLEGMDFDQKLAKIAESATDARIKEQIKRSGPKFRCLMDAYFRIFYSADYEEWISMRMAWANFNRYIREPLSLSENPEAAARAKLVTFDKMEALKKRLSEIEARLFSSEKAVKFLAEKEGSDFLGGYAEEFAQEYKY